MKILIVLALVLALTTASSVQTGVRAKLEERSHEMSQLSSTSLMEDSRPPTNTYGDHTALAETDEEFLRQVCRWICLLWDFWGNCAHWVHVCEWLPF